MKSALKSAPLTFKEPTAPKRGAVARKKGVKKDFIDKVYALSEEAKAAGFEFRYVTRRLKEAVEEYYLLEYEKLHPKKP